MPSDEELTPSTEIYGKGTKIRHYTIEKVIALGGIGVVYLALDKDLERNVALKFLSKTLCQDKESRSRFTREAKAAAQLNHPNIITIYDICEHEDQPFIAMEYVKGVSLSDYVSDRDQSIEEILELAIQISDGLAEAHKNGIIHRDIKPSNILVSNRGRAKIVDFGLAAVQAKGFTPAPGLIVGTASYMSPEQAQGLKVDARADLFSLGVVLYKVLTGKAPFTGKNLGETFEAILHKKPLPMSEYTSGVPLELERIVSRLLDKNRDNRYQSANDLRNDLRYTLEAVCCGRAQYRGRKKDYAKSIAVLPFANLSADPEQEYFCEGMAEEITNALTKVKGLLVAARTSTLAFKESKENIREIGRKLHVETLLEGSVRRSNDHLRISVQLLDVITGYHLWSERYDREVKDIFAIQDEIAQNVVRSLQLILSKDEQQALAKVMTVDSQAYDYYLRGRHLYHQGRHKSLQHAREMFTKATEVDSNYALAYAGIADCCSMLVHLYGESGDIHLAEADRTSRLAIELDPKLPQAHAARGFTLWLMDQFDKARVEFETALKMDPDQPETPYLYGRALFQRGEFEQAVKMFREACRKQEHHEARYFAAQTYTAMEKTEEALIEYRLALRATEKHVKLNPDDARAFTIGAVSLIRLGEPEAGLEWAERAVTIDPDDAGIQYNVACLYALEGEKTRAIECLENAVKAGFAHREWVEKDPDLDSLRDDPRFKTLKWRE